MQDTHLYLIMAGAALMALAMLSTTLLTAWRGWLSLKRQEISLAAERGHGGDQPSAGQRIEIADLKERIRKLEAIAAGVDL